MNKKERTKLVFETISKIAGFEVEPIKPFYVIGNNTKQRHIFTIDEDLSMWHVDEQYESNFSILPIFKGEWQLEKIKEPLLTDEEKKFLRQFNFVDLSKDELLKSTLLHLYDENEVLVATINLNGINLNFNGLKENKKYLKAEFWL